MKVRFLRPVKVGPNRYNTGDFAEVDDDKGKWLVATTRAFEVPGTSNRVETAALETGSTAARPRPKRKRSKD